MQFILYSAPSLGLWRTAPPSPPPQPTSCRRSRAGLHRSSRLNAVKPFQLLFQKYGSWMGRGEHCQHTLDDQNMSWKNDGVLTIRGKTL